MAIPDPATTEWVPIWNPLSQGPVGPQGPQGPPGTPGTFGPHAPTHYVAGGDTVDIKLLGGFSGLNTQFLRGDGVFAAPPTITGVALLASPNVFTAANTFAPSPESMGAFPILSGLLPTLNFQETDQSANTRITVLAVQNGSFVVQARDDAFNFQTNLLLINRAGAITGIGSGLTALNASNLATGLANPARLGNGPANVDTFLRGDSVWATMAGIPPGLIALFSTSCPVGWTRVAALDNRFPMGGGSYGATGGNSTHRHGQNGTTSSSGSHAHPFGGSVSGDTAASPHTVNFGLGGSLIAGSYVDHFHHFSASFSGNTDGVGDHTHTVNNDTNDVTVLPPYLTVVYCQKD